MDPPAMIHQTEQTKKKSCRRRVCRPELSSLFCRPRPDFRLALSLSTLYRTLYFDLRSLQQSTPSSVESWSPNSIIFRAPTSAPAFGSPKLAPRPSIH